MIAFRNYPRNIRHQLANVVVPRGGNCLLCQAAKVEGMEGVQQGRNLEVVPTLAVTDAQTRDRREGRWQGDGVQFEPGVDVSWAPSPNLTLNATVNPDFSQVESDQAQLDLTSNFALYFPEKRPFFMEGADYFNTPFQVLYTRQIADPDYGVRVTGRTGSGAYGADVAGIDGRWQRGGHTVIAQLLRSEAEYPATLGFDDATPSGNAWSAEYLYDSRNWFMDTWHMQVDQGFRADLGFIGQVGYDKSQFGGGRNWFFDQGSKLTRVQLYTDFDITHRIDGQLLERELEAKVSINGPMQSNFGVQGLTRVRYWDGVLFDEAYVNVFANATPPSGVQVGGNFRTGPQIDLAASRRGQGRFFDVYGNFAFGRGLSFNLDLFQQSLRRDGDTAFEATVLDTRFGWQFDPRQRIRLAVQASNVSKNPALYAGAVNRRARGVGTQLIYSYKVNPRTSVYAGGTLGGFLDDEHKDLFASSRGVFVKLSYGWQP